MRIAMPTSTFLPNLGGAEVGLHNIAKRLAGRGHKPVIMAPWPHVKELRKNNWKLPYDVISFPPKIWGVLRRWPSIGLFILDQYFRYLQWRYKFDFWHVTMGYPTGVAMVHFASSRNDVRYLIRCAGEDIQKSDDIGYGARLDNNVEDIIQRWLPRAQKLVAITESVANEYQDLGVDESRIFRVPNGVDLERFQMLDRRAIARAELDIDDETFVFLAVGRNHQKKNFIALLDAARILKDKGYQNFKVVIAGRDVQALSEKVEEYSLVDNIVLQEQIGADESGDLQLPSDALVGLYQGADAFVFPSLMETFGIVLVEAMAAKLPIITTDSPGCRDLIRKGKDGAMVPADDAKALADEMINIMSEPELRNELSERAWARAQGFSWDRVVDRYLDVYQSK
jgi:glycosyltransferase involved in cell wall biosynthesis